MSLTSRCNLGATCLKRATGLHAHRAAPSAVAVRHMSFRIKGVHVRRKKKVFFRGTKVDKIETLLKADAVQKPTYYEAMKEVPPPLRPHVNKPKPIQFPHEDLQLTLFKKYPLLRFESRAATMLGKTIGFRFAERQHKLMKSNHTEEEAFELTKREFEDEIATFMEKIKQGNNYFSRADSIAEHLEVRTEKLRDGYVVWSSLSEMKRVGCCFVNGGFLSRAFSLFLLYSLSLAFPILTLSPLTFSPLIVTLNTI